MSQYLDKKKERRANQTILNPDTYGRAYLSLNVCLTLFAFRQKNDIVFCFCCTLYLLSPRLCFFTVFKRDLFVYRDDSSTS